MDEFYIRIESLLKEQKKTQKDFAEAIGLSAPQAYITLRNRGSFPKADMAFRMAEYLGVTLEYLITGKDSNPFEQKAKVLSAKLARIEEIIRE